MAEVMSKTNKKRPTQDYEDSYLVQNLTRENDTSQLRKEEIMNQIDPMT